MPDEHRDEQSDRSIIMDKVAAPAAMDLPQDQQSQVKRRAACDECRTRKLRCTGEHPACSRCVRENITCVYSPQKQMGRPKKRQRTDEGIGEQRSGSSQAESDVGKNRAWSGRDVGTYSDSDGLQPWLLSGTDGQGMWDFDGQPVPGLTPDTGSSDSPPTLNLPPELQQSHSRTHNYTSSHPSQRDNSTALLLDPMLGSPPSTLPTCACLSTLYLTLSTLQQMDPAFPFPFALHPLRAAMTTAAEVLACDQCPKSFISSVQNTQLVGTLLTSIAERFARVLEGISTEALRAEQAGETKTFRLADLNTSTSHLHTGGLGCAAAFSINLSPVEWRGMAKKVVRAEVHGPTDGNTCCPFLLGVTAAMTARQERWHSESFEIPADCPRDFHGVVAMGRRLPREEHVCLKLAAFAEKLVSGFDWS